MNKSFFIIILIAALSSGCNNRDQKINLNKIEVDLNIERFDTLLFEMDPDTLSEGVTYLYDEFDDFLDIFSYYIISIGHPGERNYTDHLRIFLTDKLNQEVYQATLEKFSDLHDLNAIFTDAFKRYKYYFPEAEIPRVISFISRFNNPGFTVGNYLGIGLDMYLGADSEYYERMGIPVYQRRNMIPEKLPSDAINIWAGELFPFNDSVDNVLAHMIYEGKLMYFVSRLLPDQPEYLIFGFTKDQMRWLENNEEQMWIDIVERKLLFSTDAMDIRKLTGAAPFTAFFTSESPGRAGTWIGYQIVKEVARRYPDLSLSDIMAMDDYQEMLKLSRYNPD